VFVAVCMSHLLGRIDPDLCFSYGNGISKSKSWLRQHVHIPAVTNLKGPRPFYGPVHWNGVNK